MHSGRAENLTILRGTLFCQKYSNTILSIN
jgi:hypothetical protein